jgi:hypothetical protein
VRVVQPADRLPILFDEPGRIELSVDCSFHNYLA